MSSHPVVAGREDELASLTNAVRRLVDLTVTNDAPRSEISTIAAELEVLADRLGTHVPSPPPPRYVLGSGPDASAGERMPFDPVVGMYSPLALPVVIEVDPPRAVGRARFTTPYEGPPGCVHGAVIAATFDMVCNSANQLAGVAGPTARLTIRYRRPTLLHHDLYFEAEIVRTSGRRTTTKGQILQDGVVTAEAEGVFVKLPHADLARMGRRPDGSGARRGGSA